MQNQDFVNKIKDIFIRKLKTLDVLDDYIDEVCETNHIYDRQITDGMYLVIPYYTVRR